MSKEALKLALEALGEIEWSNNSPWQSDRAKVAITALRQALANEALDKMAENARELGLDYEPAQRHGWKLVPLEPTQEMIDAVPTKPHPTRPNGWGDRNVAIYKAMIGAAPLPAQQEPVAYQDTADKCRLETVPAKGGLLPQRTWVGLTKREVELIDGMIEVQLHHAAQCDRIANRTMAEKQKGWDMERVELLRKLKDKNNA